MGAMDARVLLATFCLMPEGEPGGSLLVDALAERGVEAAWATWDDPAVDWAGADLVAVRSTWDYQRRLPAWRDWVRRVEASTGLLNGGEVFDWNTDKAYLETLGEHVPVVPSELVDDEDLVGGLGSSLYSSTDADFDGISQLDEGRLGTNPNNLDTDGDGIRETPDGVPMMILYQTSTNTVRQATQELIKQDWAKIGVDTELRNIDASVFFGGDPGSPDTYGKFYADVEMYTNGAAGVDSQSYMGSWTTANISGRDTTWQGSNVQRFQSDEYDALHAELTQTADMARRNEITIALNDLVVGNYSIIPLIHRGSVSAHAKSLTGVKLNPWDAELWNLEDWARN